jgi:hypothetical protein
MSQQRTTLAALPTLFSAIRSPTVPTPASAFPISGGQTMFRKYLGVIAAGIAFVAPIGCSPTRLVDSSGQAHQGTPLAFHKVLPTHIIGSDAVKPNTLCEYRSSVDSGVPPYAYIWTQNGTTVGTDSSVTVNTGTTGFWLHLSVSDADVDKGYDSLFVSVANKPGFTCTTPP